MIGWFISLVKNPVVFALMVLAAGIATVLVSTFSVTWLPTLWTVGALSRANYSAALRRVRLLRRFQPRSPLFLFLHGTVLLFAGHHAEAEKLLRESLAEGQNNPSLAKAQGNALENLGYALLEQQRYGEAIQAFEGSIEIIPESAGPYSGLAEVYLRQGIKPERALELMEKALEHKLRSRQTRRTDLYRLGKMWGNHAWALAMLGQHTKAAESLDHAFSEANQNHKPGLAGLYYRAGQTMRLRGAQATATEYLERAREIDPQGTAGNLAARALTEGDSQQE
jgi:tetratricopeptide (TPR) repeat protein